MQQHRLTYTRAPRSLRASSRALLKQTGDHQLSLSLSLPSSARTYILTHKRRRYRYRGGAADIDEVEKEGPGDARTDFSYQRAGYI